MKIYSIEEGELHTSLNTPYDSENNKIDVYCSVSWSGIDKEDYQRRENIVNCWAYEDDLITAYSWCDSSGFDYWVIQQEEENYVSIDVYLKKLPSKYTQEEIEKISNVIFDANLYFEENI